MPIKIEIPDTQVGSLKTYYKNVYNDFLIKAQPLIQEWTEIEPILRQLGIITTSNPFKLNGAALAIPKAVSNLDGYKPTWSWKEKATFVISHHGKLTPKEIIKILENYEPAIGAKAKNSLPATLSVAANEGKGFTRQQNDKGDYIYDVIKQ